MSYFVKKLYDYITAQHGSGSGAVIKTPHGYFLYRNDNFVPYGCEEVELPIDLPPVINLMSYYHMSFIGKINYEKDYEDDYGNDFVIMTERQVLGQVQETWCTSNEQYKGNYVELLSIFRKKKS